MDLPETFTEELALPFQTSMVMISDISAENIIFKGKNHTRVTIMLYEPVIFRSKRTNNLIILELETGKDLPDSDQIFKSEKTMGKYGSLKAVKYTTKSNSFELEAKLSKKPDHPLIYMMKDPDRIVLDLTETYVENASEKEIEPSPVNKLSVIKTPGDPPFTSVVMGLDQNCTFDFQLTDTTIIVKVASIGRDWKKIKKWLYIGSGIALGAGVTTGILISQTADGPGKKEPENLGAPPELPE